ncbi:MAG: AsmA family protein [Gammaproteobacteria bacterium]|nr:AsmA family protein [Gammaproteobacteria bacterium]MDH3417072.1 AsmA family protein [Gammaproteobacteria bacterium]
MGRLVKFFLYFITAIVAIFLIAAISFFLLFDANDFRDDFAAQVKKTTGRELTIAGDIELSLFPWLAIDIGETHLGNAEGFSDEPFVSFNQARLSVRIMPVLLRREVSIGTALLDGLDLNLEIARNGRSNWQELIDVSEAKGPAPQEDETGAPALDIASINIRNASVRYTDNQAGESYRLTNLNLSSGRVAEGEPLPLSTAFDFEMQPADISGGLEMEAVASAGPTSGTIGFSDVEISVLGIDISANVEPFSYVDDAIPTALIQVKEFSLKELMAQMNVEPPLTADPDAMNKVLINATVQFRPEAIALKELDLVLDDTTFTGDLALASDAAGTISVNLSGDSINLDRYMAPADEAGAESEDVAPVEVPADLVRSLNLRGNFKVAEAVLGGMRFENAELGLKAANGKLRMYPISAQFFDGTYSGDVSVDASGRTAVLSVNEKVRDVNVGAMALAMFKEESVTGTINGSFELTGRGNDLGAIQSSLQGQMSFELLDGAWEGTDVWYELRRARALLKKEEAPEPTLPARTPFSSVTASGPVRDGVFRNDNLHAELPFMRLTGNGAIDLPAATIDYSMTARVFERPEFVEGATAEELDEFTEAVIPLKITGPLASPSIKPDVQKMLKKEVRKKAKERLLDKLLGDAEEEPAEGATEQPADGAVVQPPEGEADQPAEEEQDDKDKLKDALKDLLKR